MRSGDWWDEDLERDEVDEEFGIGVEGLGIGGDISPELFQCGRCLRRSRVQRSSRIVNGSAKAPVPPSYREHHQSRSHAFFLQTLFAFFFSFFFLLGFTTTPLLFKP